MTDVTVARSIAIGVACVFSAVVPCIAADMPARPNSLPGCYSAMQAIAWGQAVVTAHPKASVFTDYSGDEAVKLLAEINAVPPATDYPAEHVLVIELPDHDFVTVALVHDGCAKGRLQTTTEGWGELRRSALAPGDAL